MAAQWIVYLPPEDWGRLPHNSHVRVASSRIISETFPSVLSCVSWRPLEESPNWPQIDCAGSIHSFNTADVLGLVLCVNYALYVQ